MLFTIFLVICTIAFVGADINLQKIFSVFFLLFFVFIISNRDANIVPDAIVYKISFENSPPIYNVTKYSVPFGYDEMGFFYIGCLIKTITSNYQIYFGVYGAICMLFLYKFISKYSVIPLLSIIIYYTRFLVGRDFVQMRSSLAILLVMLALQYAYKKNIIKYMLLVSIAYTIHKSSFIAFPFYFINLIHFKRNWIIYGLIIAMVLSITLASFLANGLVVFLSESNYISGDTSGEGKGFGNPIIYWQLIILLFYTFNEKRLVNNVSQYYTLRTAYFYSTFVLIAFSHIPISGRASTMFATVEIILLPLTIWYSDKNKRYIYLIFVIIGILFFQFMRNNGGEMLSF